MPGSNILKLRMRMESLRILLLRTGEQLGLDHPDTLRISQRFDRAHSQFEIAKREAG
jgi:hypothetical protein